MDIVEINEHIRKLKCEETNWQSVEKLAALCTVRNELSEAESRENSPTPFTGSGLFFLPIVARNQRFNA